MVSGTLKESVCSIPLHWVKQEQSKYDIIRYIIYLMRWFKNQIIHNYTITMVIYTSLYVLGVCVLVMHKTLNFK